MFKRAERLLLQKWFMPPFSWVIHPLAQPQVANQRKKNFPLSFLIYASFIIESSEKDRLKKAKTEDNYEKFGQT